ncbi:hypothetical protein NDU88_011174, partial [Pleurodeles waltl]
MQRFDRSRPTVWQLNATGTTSHRRSRRRKRLAHLGEAVLVRPGSSLNLEWRRLEKRGGEAIGKIRHLCYVT